LSLREVVDALDGTEVRSLSVQPVTLEDAYLEFVDAPDELIKIFTKTINQ
jgi:tmRNA-binding protein